MLSAKRSCHVCVRLGGVSACYVKCYCLSTVDWIIRRARCKPRLFISDDVETRQQRSGVLLVIELHKIHTAY